MRRSVVVILTILLVVTAVGLSAQKTKPTKPAPPPPANPLVLGSGLNIVSLEIDPVRQIRAWRGLDDGSFQVSWTQAISSGLMVAMGDIDGLGDSEIVVPVACTASDGSYRSYLTVYKQGVSGIAYAGTCEGAGSVPVSLTSYELQAADLDNDGADEIVLRTMTSLAVFDREASTGTWQTRSTWLGQGLVGEGFNYFGHSLAIGNLDGDGVPDIVTSIFYRDYRIDPLGEDKTFVLVFTPGLTLKGSLALFDITSPDLRSFMVNNTDGLAIGNFGSGPEIVVGGWTAHRDINQVDQRVLSLHVSAGVPVSVEEVADYGLSPLEGPAVFSGRLSGATDALVVTNFDDYTKVEVRDNGIWQTYHAAGAPSRAVVADGRIVIGGLLQPYRKLKKGIFYEVLDANLQQSWSYGLRDGSEFWTFIVGYGRK